MLFTSGMEKKFWAEAVATAVKLINKCPSSSIDGDTPDLRWYGSYGDYSHIRNFGCKAFAYIKQTKLDARALRCVMLGYQQGVKGYRLWCIEPGNHKVLVSRDVTFMETEMPFKKQEKPENSSQPAVHFEVESKDQTDDESSELQTENEVVDTEMAQPPDLRNYQLTRDRGRRNVKPHLDLQTLNCCTLLCVWLRRLSFLSLGHTRKL